MMFMLVKMDLYAYRQKIVHMVLMAIQFCTNVFNFVLLNQEPLLIMTLKNV